MDNTASAVPVLIYMLLLGLASVFVLLFGDVLQPIVNILPDGAFKSFLALMWPLGILLAFFLALTFALFQTMQKEKYRSGGGWQE